ncbi:AAA family ATPase [Labilibaculum manganireducens]|uniref:AAA family ATPase n=1 Tax=Labilibaculum manganireducens TaxID=1940525 RepID=UPI0029F50B80|nr:AAA family ATPase [Labilibaculum manganireducens]
MRQTQKATSEEAAFNQLQDSELNSNFNFSIPEILQEVQELTNVEKPSLADQLANLRIDPTQKLDPPERALEILNTKTGEYDIIGTMGNFSLIIGKAKAKKSFLINLIVSAMVSLKDSVNRFRSLLASDKEVILYFDTEQSKYHVQLAVKRICKQIGVSEPTNLLVYGLRSKSPQERLELIEYAIYNTPNLGIVVIDGVKDLIGSINDEEAACLVASKFLKWTEEKNMHLITVLHQNKGDNNARGHIGTELINKGETVLSVTKDSDDGDVSLVEPLQCRNKEPESFAFRINEEGLPVIIDDYTPKVSGVKKPASNALLGLDPLRQYNLIIEAFKHTKKTNYSSLVIQVKLAYRKIHFKNIGDNKIKEFLTYCKNENFIIQEVEKGDYSIGNPRLLKS